MLNIYNSSVYCSLCCLTYCISIIFYYFAIRLILLSNIFTYYLLNLLFFIHVDLIAKFNGFVVIVALPLPHRVFKNSAYITTLICLYSFIPLKSVTDSLAIILAPLFFSTSNVSIRL